MAARNQHVLDSTVVERRLRPIYEWLDSGNPKKALQETEKVLRKTPNLQCAKALKALSLLQLGREAECVGILEALAAEVPSDNSTLQAMTICYRDLGKLEKVCNLYEKAVQADPSNEELHTHLFMSYVRTSNFQQQHQSAMTLYKMKQKNPYYFWAIMSILLQATKGQGKSEPTKRNVLLSLAEKMVEKFFNENKLEAGQEIQLYLMILELQGKFAQALEVLDGPLGTKLLSGSTDENRINYLTKLCKWNDLNKLCNDLLTSNMDRWDIWNHYLTSMFELSKTITNQETDDTPEKAHEFICSVIETIGEDNLFKNSSSYQLRGPYLARLELCSRLRKINKDPTHLLGDLFQLFVEYFRLFGHKPCCVSDLKIYLNLLEPERRIQLAEKLLKDVDLIGVTVPQTEKQMQRHICALQLSRLCGAHCLKHSMLVQLVEALKLHYKNGAKNFGTGKLPTDQGPADAYALLAVHTLYDLFILEKNSRYIVEALILLEMLLKSSPSNFHAKLLAVRLYHYIGAGEGAQKLYESLDTKYLQMDSLGFIHCACLHPSGLLQLTGNLYDTTLKFFSTNYRDSIDHLTFSYKYGSFLKLEEFMEFRNRLNNSLHYTLTAIDRMLLEIILCSSLKSLNIDAKNNINWDLLRDNNDYNVYLSWDMERVNGPLDAAQEIREYFEQNTDLARIRAGVISAISNCLDLAKNDDKETQLNLMEQTLEEWLNICKKIEDKSYDYKPVQGRLSLPVPSRLYPYINTPYRIIIEPLMRLIICATRKKDTSINIDDLKTSLNKLQEQLNETIPELCNRRQFFENLVNNIELLCIACILCSISHELLKPATSTATQKKSKKKTVQSAGDSNNINLSLKNTLTEIVEHLRKCCTSYQQYFDLLQTQDLQEQLNALKLHEDDEQNIVFNYIRTSHTNALKDLKTALLNKYKLLNIIH